MRSNRFVLRALQDLAHIEPGAEATRRAIERASSAVLEAASTTALSTPSRRKIMSLRNVVAVTAALAAIFLLAHWLTPTGSPGGIAFADVQAQVAKTKTVRYVETRTNRLRDGRKIQGLIRRVQILGSHRMREELTHTPGDAPEPGDSDTYVQIHDAKNGISMTLYPDKNSYRYVTRILGIKADGQIVESKPEPNPQIDFYARIRQLPTEKAVKIADKFVDGKVAAGFEVIEKIEHAQGTDTTTRKYWVDPETKLPVRIEVSLRSTVPGRAESDFVQSDIAFDEPLDEALFSTEPPPGYKDRAADAEKKLNEE